MSETKTIKVNDDFQSAFDGLMLGDGCVTIVRKKCFSKIKEHSIIYEYHRYAQICKYRDWLETIKLWFLEHNFSSSLNTLNNHITTFNLNGSTHHQLRAWNNEYFKEQRKRWYDWSDSDGWEYEKIQKVVPEDIVLTPAGVANWFMGDGSLIKYSNYGCRIHFATNGFIESDVDFLCDLLEHYITIKAHKYLQRSLHNFGYIISINKRSNVDIFIEYVKPHIHPIYAYKIGGMECLIS